MSRSSVQSLPSPAALRWPVFVGRLASCIRTDAVRRLLCAHAALGASVVLVVGWRPVVLWLALAAPVTVGAATFAPRALAGRPLRAKSRLLTAARIYAAPALLAALAAAHGGAGLAAAVFIGAGLFVHGLGHGDVAAGVRWLRRRRAARLAFPGSAQTVRPRTAAAPAASGQAMRTLLADLLDLSRLESGRLAVEKTPFDLRALIAAAAGDWRPAALHKGLAFEVAGEAKAPRWVEGDPVRIRQILDTLLANALKFTSAGSVSLTLGVEPRPDGRVDLTVSVLDSGPGMTSAQLARAFDPRLETDPELRGPAQGLSGHLAREIARLMGGELTASSAPGLGAAFSLKVPLRLVDGGLTDVDTARGLRVLVVDDHAVYRHAFSLILETVCREVVCAEDGIEALDLLAAETFDLVLMDLAMPRLGGLPATRRLRASSSRNRDVAVIALTASDSEEDRAACLAAGMNGFVSKPVDARELLGAIHAVLSEATPQAA